MGGGGVFGGRTGWKGRQWGGLHCQQVAALADLQDQLARASLSGILVVREGTLQSLLSSALCAQVQVVAHVLVPDHVVVPDLQGKNVPSQPRCTVLCQLGADSRRVAKKSSASLPLSSCRCQTRHSMWVYFSSKFQTNLEKLMTLALNHLRMLAFEACFSQRSKSGN